MLHDSSIPPEHTTIWYDVHRAQTLAQAVAREGVNTSAVDKVARDWLDGRGYKGYFTHRLGHGENWMEHRLVPWSNHCPKESDLKTMKLRTCVVDPTIQFKRGTPSRTSQVCISKAGYVSQNLHFGPTVRFVLSNVDKSRTGWCPP